MFRAIEKLSDRKHMSRGEVGPVLVLRASRTAARIHPRVPVILHARDYDRWLDREETDLLRPHESEEMEVYEPIPRSTTYGTTVPR